MHILSSAALLCPAQKGRITFPKRKVSPLTHVTTLICLHVYELLSKRNTACWLANLGRKGLGEELAFRKA